MQRPWNRRAPGAPEQQPGGRRHWNRVVEGEQAARLAGWGLWLFLSEMGDPQGSEQQSGVISLNILAGSL